jgi:hypothetical protein
VRIVDDATYDGQVWIDDPGRWAGLTIEAAPGASPTLTASTGRSVVTIRGVPGVVLRGLAIRPRPGQAAVFLAGRLDGVTLVALRSEKPADSPAPHVRIAPGSRGSSARPLAVRACRFSGGEAGIEAEGSPGQAVRFLVVERSRFRDLGVHLALRGNLADVSVAGNRFSGGEAAILVDVPPLRASRLTIDRNSILGVRRWLDPGDSDPEQDDLVVSRNAVLDPPGDDPDARGRLATLARLGWHFEANLKESGESHQAPDNPVIRLVDRLAVVSRDPDSPDFLRPAPGSRLSGDGPGGYVGAFPPAVD